MSDVFEAEHPLLRCRVALAVVRTPPEQIRSPARFARAMELAAGLDHPAIVRVFEHGVTAEGTPFCVMELVRGVSLSRAIEVGGPMPEGRVVHLMRQLCGGLAHVHGQRLVHRDVKPSNVLIVRDGFDLVKLIDLDLLSPAAERGQSGSVRADGARDADELERVLDSPTPIGAPAAPVRGTPLFLAPEAILDPDGIDARADVYALGALAYLLLTGEAPLPSGSIGRAIERQLHDVPEPPSARIGRELSTDLETLVLECLAKQPEARPRDTAALEARLAACVDADAWTYGEARAWWAQHAAALEPQPGVAAGEAVLIVPR